MDLCWHVLVVVVPNRRFIVVFDLNGIFYHYTRLHLHHHNNYDLVMENIFVGMPKPTIP